MPKQKKIPVEVTVFAPRCNDSMFIEVQIDPDGLSLKPTVDEITKVAKATVLDKLKLKVADGREVLKDIKAARKEAIEDARNRAEADE